MRIPVLALAAALVVAACSSSTTDQSAAVPSVPAATSDEPTDAALRMVTSIGPVFDLPAMRELVATGDERWAWILADSLRFFVPGSPESAGLVGGIEDLTGFTVDESSPWVDATNQLINSDIDAPPEYERSKRALFATADERWGPMLTDVVAFDLRYVAWGGVFPDDRPFGATDACGGRGCIPALDEPAVTTASGGDWYADDNVVFGVVIDGEARAYPKNMMEVHEMVNDTLGRRQFAMPYCTLCGSAQAYFTDDVAGVDGRVVLRTSGLLQRSNKVMFDLATASLWDTFAGVAVSGPLGAAGVELEQVTVEVSTWGEWKTAHPDTTIVASDGGIGRTYAPDPLRGRDDAGPIFPIGDVDPRLPVQEQVVAVESPDGTAVAFPVQAARAAVDAGAPVIAGGITLTSDGGGFRATDSAGAGIAAHQAFWFAWVQRNPETIVWMPEL